MTSRQQGSGPVRGPGTATPGSTIDIEVDGPGSVVVTQPGRPLQRYPVTDGQATIPVPAGTAPGTQLHILLLGRIPPTGHTVTIVAK